MYLLLVLSFAIKPIIKRKCSINIDFIVDKCSISMKVFLFVPQFLEIPGQILFLPFPHLKLTDRFLSLDSAQAWQLDHFHWSKDSPLLDSTDDHLGPSYEF